MKASFDETAKQTAGHITNLNKEQQKLESFLRIIVKKSRKNGKTREYFSRHGINEASIEKFQLGVWNFEGHDRLVIPVYTKTGKLSYLMLRLTPDDEPAEDIAKLMGQDTTIDKDATYPANVNRLLVGEDELARSKSVDVLICRDEFERMVAIQEGAKIPVVTSCGIMQSFKKDWIESLKNMRNIYLCLGEDHVGKRGTQKLAEKLAEEIPTASIFKVTLPFEPKERKNLVDYFTEKCGTADDLLEKYSEYLCGEKPIDESKFKEMTVENIAKVLDSTIKYDFVSKTVTFLAMILAYTDSDQLNIMFNADSSTGKTYICTEVSKLFPPQDVKIFGKITPNAFYYSKMLGRVDEKTKQPYTDLARLILIFMEQPDAQLQANLRSLLSHDNKKIPYALTNRNKSGRNSADEGYMLGYPSAFFCSANMHIDEQEQTRCLILSPESTRKKLLASIDASINKNKDKDAYDTWLESDEARKQLKERILHIKRLNVGNIKVTDTDYLKEKFIKSRRAIRPKAQRDVSHFLSLVKAMALINAPFRMVDGAVVANRKDVDEALKLWAPLTESDFYGISPQVYDFYKKYVLGAYYAKKKESAEAPAGITYKELIKEYFDQTGSYPNVENIRKQYIPALETASLIEYVYDKGVDGRQRLIIPLVFLDDDSVEK